MKVIIAAGGTGGHVFPALALAKVFEKHLSKQNIIFVGTERGMEKNLVSQAGYPLELISIGKVKGQSLLNKIKQMVFLPYALWTARLILKKHRPVCVLGIGGYASFPILLMAWIWRIPTGILEPNVKAGLTNRLLSRLSTRVFVAFDKTKQQFQSKKVLHVGNPIREEILKVQAPKHNPKSFCILVFGGSQGAHGINQLVCQSLFELEDIKENIRFIHQTGVHDVDYVKRTYHTQDFQADVRVFIDDMAKAYEESHIIIARSGSSVLEMASVGRPSYLIPYPYAADDHQYHNAKIISDAKAGVLKLEADCNPKDVSDFIRNMYFDEHTYIQMSQSALKLRNDQAALKIVQEMFSLDRGQSK